MAEVIWRNSTDQFAESWRETTIAAATNPIRETACAAICGLLTNSALERNLTTGLMLRYVSE